MNKLLLLFIPIALVVIVPTPCLGNANYKNICLNSSNYNGSATVTVYGGATGTCDSRIASSSFQGKNFATLSCINDFDSGDVTKSNTQSLLRYYERDCCTDKKSICWKDFSKLCKTPSNYNGDGMHGNYRCDYYLHSQSGIDWNDPASTTSDSVKYTIKQVGTACCSDGKSALHVDYSKICKNPGTYDGTKSVTIGGGTNTCDDVISQGEYKNLNFATLKCDDFNSISKYDLENHYVPSCCSNKKSLCYRDFSKLCKDPSIFVINNDKKKYLFCIRT